MIEENNMALATSSNNKPHVIAVADVKVVSNNQILISDNYMNQTVNNIKNNKKVSLVVWDEDIGYEFDGEAEYFNGGKWLNKVKEIHKGYPAKGAILITINKIKNLK